MTVYIVNWIFITLNVFFIRNRLLSVTLIGMSLFLILACRENNLGVDLVGYEWCYDYIGDFSFKEMVYNTRFFKSTNVPCGHESGYDWFQWIIANAGFSFHSFLVIHAAICMFSISHFVYKYSSRPWFSFILFLSLGMYGNYFGILRLMLAQVILLANLDNIHKGNFIGFLFMLCMAILFHRASILAFPFFFMARFSFSKLKYLYFIFVCVIWAFIIPYIFTVFIQFFLSFLAGDPYEMEFKGNNMIILIVIMSIFVAIMSHKIPSSKGHNNLLIWGCMLSVPVEILSIYIPIFSRFAISFYLLFATILVPNLINKLESKPFRIIITMILYLGGMIFYFLKMSQRIVPYRAYF